ncbi:MAG: flagellar basal body rod protein FlgB, partial [Succinivibrio sp.]|nr:flagellar basal body rod protein FlgB [Succinivibrio sp.]
MGITFDKAFGIHQHTMLVRNKRSEVLAGNLANADTPGYKARDLDFKLALQQQAHVRELPSQTQIQMVKTSKKHMDLSDLPDDDPERTL